MIKNKITTLFNIATVSLYGIGESLQKIYAKTDIPVYDSMGSIGPYIQGHFSDFFGAAALSGVANILSKDVIKNHRIEFCSVASLALLTYHEYTNQTTGSFDWVDMTAYVGAVGLTHAVYKHEAKKRGNIFASI